MSIFEDTGFDLLPKIPVPGNTPVIIQPIQTPPIVPPAVPPVTIGTPDPIPPKKGGSGFGWFLFGLLILGTVGTTIYMANKDSARKKSTEN
jgi:hypothetical protein